MKRLKSYNKFKESMTFIGLASIDLRESLLKDHKDLFTTVCKKEDISKLYLDDSTLDLEALNNSELPSGSKFITSLSSLGLKKSQINDSKDFENFINKPCRFMFLYKIEKVVEIENPDFILFQTWNESLQKWDELELYSVEADINKFLDRLTSRTIQITDADQNYVYTTSNGNDWILEDDSTATEVFKKNLTKEELQKIINEQNVEFNIK